MEIGGCSFSFGPKPLREALRILKDLGFTIADVGVCPGNTQIHPLQAARAPEATSEEARKGLDEMNLRPEECFVLDFGDPLNHPDDESRHTTLQLFLGLVKFASLVGFRSIMLIPGVVYPELGWERCFELSVSMLRELVKMSEERGVHLNIEPCEPSVAQDPQDALRLCQQVPGLGLTLDYSHFIDPGFAQSSVEPLHHFARHYHARQAAPGKRVETMRAGTIDFKRILGLLHEQKFSGVVAVEYVDCDVTTQCGVKVLEETIKMKAELTSLLSIV